MCAQLHSLNISGCSALEHVSLACPALESLSAAQCARLEALPEQQLRCPALRTANFAGCNALEGAPPSLGTPVFTPTCRRCRMLRLSMLVVQ